MQLPGRLERTTLGDILGGFYRERITGVLELIQPSRVEHRVCVQRGLVNDVQSPASPRLGDLLRKLGAISPQQSPQVERIHLAELMCPLGQALLDQRLITQEHLQTALKAQQRARLENLFRLRSAGLRFRVARSSDEGRSPLSVVEFLHGRPRKRDRRQGDGSTSTAFAVDERVKALRVLGLSSEASEREVRGAFRKLAAAMHPDRLAHLERNERIRSQEDFVRLSRAYHALVA